MYNWYLFVEGEEEDFLIREKKMDLFCWASMSSSFLAVKNLSWEGNSSQGTHTHVWYPA